MWYLIEQKDPCVPSPRYWLGGITGGGRTIGRKQVDIRLRASSVSRTHARITILKSSFYSPSNPRRHHSTSVSVQDSSAYGTFLKYPPGHSSNRAQRATGHHRRLDKDTPVDVCEGALLAFGAPSAWWKLSWFHILLVPSRISSAERERIMSIAALTGVEVSENWGEDATHLVTTECCTSSSKFMTALAENKLVVTPAWVEALRHKVTESCRAIADAQEDIPAALSACALADEKLFIPPFSKADVAAFQPEHLVAVFNEDVRERRKDLFKDIVVAFGKEEKRSRWAAIIELLGGTATLAKVAGESDLIRRIVYVKGEYSGGHRPHEDVPGRAYVQETALIHAIVQADLAPLAVTTGGKATTAEMADVATPGPLDSESDVDTDDESEAAGAVRKHANERERALAVEKSSKSNVKEGEKKIVGEVVNLASPMEIERPTTRSSQEGTIAAVAQNNGVRKRTRVTSEKGTEGATARELKRKEGPEEPHTPAAPDAEGGVEAVVEGEVAIDNSNMNERVFFKVDGDLQGGENHGDGAHLDGSMSRRKTHSIVRDVRRFRRRKLPSATVIPLKRVRCVENLESGFDRTPVAVEACSHGKEESDGAKVMESKGERE